MNHYDIRYALRFKSADMVFVDSGNAETKKEFLEKIKEKHRDDLNRAEIIVLKLSENYKNVYTNESENWRLFTHI